MFHRALRIAITSLALMLALSGSAGLAQTLTPQETARSVRHVLERLTYYGVFDFIVFAVDGGTVRLAGYTYQPGLKDDAVLPIRWSNCAGLPIVLAS